MTYHDGDDEDDGDDGTMLIVKTIDKSITIITISSSKDEGRKLDDREAAEEAQFQVGVNV